MTAVVLGIMAGILLVGVTFQLFRLSLTNNRQVHGLINGSVKLNNCKICGDRVFIGYHSGQRVVECCKCGVVSHRYCSEQDLINEWNRGDR